MNYNVTNEDLDYDLNKAGKMSKDLAVKHKKTLDLLGVINKSKN